MERPKSVKVATALLLIGLLLSIPSLIINAIYAPEHYSRSLMLGVGIALVLLFAVITYLIYFGKNLARLLYTGMATVGLVWGIRGPNAEGTHHYFVEINHWVGLVLSVVIVVLLFLPSSSRWYKAQRNL